MLLMVDTSISRLSGPSRYIIITSQGVFGPDVSVMALTDEGFKT